MAVLENTRKGHEWKDYTVGKKSVFEKLDPDISNTGISGKW